MICIHDGKICQSLNADLSPTSQQMKLEEIQLSEKYQAKENNHR